ncbi:MAG: pyruvate dehydrogenase (acetyl-transferring) E1 component subunit alpha [Planctomycetes bacterium GWF2_50_10]|nr:MAG: pyruvate dehydrogenase (acetyl-transferring) E1 component subunit alpha [Planctomycetes bacterium GWF2_50_10]
MPEISNYDPQLLKKLLYDMQLIRRFEEEATKRYGLREFGGFLHLYIGQEAIAVGAVAAIDLQKDYILTAYRDHGFALAVGMDPSSIMAELYGKQAGTAHGKGGSMHFFDKDRHFFGGNGIVGAHIPLATGVAFKIKYMSEPGAVLCFFGDGAIHQGTFHESVNIARIWKLPIVYICENNQYAMGTDFRRVSAVKDLSKLSCAYAIPGSQVDGMDILAVNEEIKKAAQLARDQKMPTLLECKTYRYVGHSMSDPGTYRTKEEITQYRQNDPILLFKDKLIVAKIITDADFDQIDTRCKDTVTKAVEFARTAPDPPTPAMYEDLYV